MKMKPALFFLLFLVFGCQQQDSPDRTNFNDPRVEETAYNPQLAEELGADAYGMRQYVLAFLKSGPNRSQDSLKAAQLQKAHLDNISRLAEEGKLVLAGPFMDRGEVRGIYIFNVTSLEEAKALTESDPAVQAGRLVMELHPWYGSAALVMLNQMHRQLAKKSF